MGARRHSIYAGAGTKEGRRITQVEPALNGVYDVAPLGFFGAHHGRPAPFSPLLAARCLGSELRLFGTDRGIRCTTGTSLQGGFREASEK